MNHSFQYFKNEFCKYFPCHKVENTEDFNCLLCFCPLYFLEDCGGNCSYLHGIKDCTDCFIPHEPGGYEFITKRILAENKKKRAESRE